MDINELKRMTQEAVEEQKRQAELERQRKEREAAAKIEAQKQRARLAISQIELLCKTEAAKGKNNAAVFEIKYDDCERSSGRQYTNFYQPQYLIGAAKEVWDYLVEVGLNPEIVYTHDGVGINSWYHIHATW